jgi:arylsulfatase
VIRLQYVEATLVMRDKTVPVHFSTDDTFDVGEDWGTPMSDAYEPPFAFTGKIKTVTVHAKAP